MMRKTMRLWMHLILSAAFTSAYANQVDCDFEKDSCNWSIEGFKRISDNQFNSTMHQNDCNFLGGICRCEGKEWNVPTKVNYTVAELKSKWNQSVLTSRFDIYPGETCLLFEYEMKDFKRECNFIEMYTNDGVSWSEVWWSQSQNQSKGWNEINVTINVKKKSKIAIRFLHGNCSDVTYYIRSISLKEQSCTESTTTIRTTASTAIPMNSSKETMTPKITTKSRINTIVKLSTSDIATTTAATSVNTSSHYANDGVIIGIVIGGLAFTVAVLLIATYLYRRRATNRNANISKDSTVSSVTYSGATRPKTENGDTSHSTERLNQTSDTVPFNAQTEYSSVLKTQPRQSKTQERCITGIFNIYPCQVQLLNNDGNSVTNPEQTHNQYHQSAEKGGTSSYDAVHNTDNHTTKFRDDTYDCTTIHPTTIPDPTYDHSNFKQNFDNIYDNSTSSTLNKDMGYLDHSCDTTLQRSMQDVDPTYDHI